MGLDEEEERVELVWFVSWTLPFFFSSLSVTNISQTSSFLHLSGRISSSSSPLHILSNKTLPFFFLSLHVSFLALVSSFSHTNAHSFLSLLPYYPSIHNFLTCHFSKASPRSPLCVCALFLSLSVAVPLCSQTLHSIHLCLSPASPHSPHPSLLLPYAYPLSFLSSSWRVMATKFLLDLVQQKHTHTHCHELRQYVSVWFLLVYFLFFVSLCNIYLRSKKYVDIQTLHPLNNWWPYSLYNITAYLIYCRLSWRSWIFLGLFPVFMLS